MAERMNENNNANMMNDEELDKVSGGWVIADWINSVMDYKSGDTPVWHVGRRVRYNYSALDGNGKEGKITSVSDKACGGIINKEFLYTIVRDDGYVDKGVYESSIWNYVD